ncbi:unnamed protein product, partial [Brassica oleracea var. botrytis]
QEIKGRKRKNPSSISDGVSTRTRARKAVSDGNEPVGEDVVHEESTRVREKTEFSLSLDSEKKFFQFARPNEKEELARLKERCVVQAQKLWRQIEEEESDENSVESLAEEEVEKTQENTEKLVEEPEKTVEEVEKTTEEEATHVIYTEEEKKSWYMVVYKGSEEESPTKEAVTPAKKKAKAEKKKVDDDERDRESKKSIARAVLYI